MKELCTRCHKREAINRIEVEKEGHPLCDKCTEIFNNRFSKFICGG